MAKAVSSLAVSAILFFSGCLGANDAPDVQVPEPTALVEGLVAHNGEGLLELAEAPFSALDLVYRHVGHSGGEPNIGVTSAGNVFVTADERTLRSSDHGQTWEEVYDFSVARLPRVTSPGERQVRTTSDPMLWVDPLTDRVFTNHMWPTLVCSTNIISDDEGESWMESPLACGIPGLDHQKLMTAPPGPESLWPESPVYPNPVYLCYNKIASTNCAVSHDGGLTFPYDAPLGADELFPCGGLNGHPGAGPDGTVYVAITVCDTVYVGITRDSGLTWSVENTHFPTQNAEDNEIAATPDGTAYLMYAGADNLQYLGRSPDHGKTWLGPWRISPPEVKSTFFEGMVAGDDGRLAFAYLGTRDGRGANPQDVPDDAHWHLFYSFTDDAESDDPTFYTVQVTPDEDPVQVGCIWISGFTVEAPPCRNMLDFIDMTMDREGRPYITYTEGCTGSCIDNESATGDHSDSSEVAVAVLDAGPSLYRSVGELPSLSLASWNGKDE